MTHSDLISVGWFSLGGLAILAWAAVHVAVARWGSCDCEDDNDA